MQIGRQWPMKSQSVNLKWVFFLSEALEAWTTLITECRHWHTDALSHHDYNVIDLARNLVLVTCSIINSQTESSTVSQNIPTATVQYFLQCSLPFCSFSSNEKMDGCEEQYKGNTRETFIDTGQNKHSINMKYILYRLYICTEVHQIVI